jgi:lipopolysaccharide assembly outer membrane protein LptD (OstA)
MIARRALPAVLFVSLFFGGTATAQSPDTAEGGTSVSHIAGFDHIQTDKFDYNLNTGDFSIPGHFTATRQGTDVTADHATGNSKAKVMHAEGHVIVHQTPGGPPGHTSELTSRPSTLTCDKLDVDGTRKLYTATGNMHYTQEGGREATSDTAVLDDASHHLHMQGHVHVRSGDQTVDSDALDYDTVTGQLDGNGNVTITAPVETPAPGPARTPRPKKRKLP